MSTNRINFLSSVAIGSIFIFIPLIARDLGASDFSIGLIVSIYGATNLISFFIFGRLSDTIGRKIFIMIGLALSSATFITHIFAFDVASLFLIRATAGFAVGIYPAALTAYVWERQKKLGTFTAYSSLGWAVGSLLAGAIATYKGMFIISSLSFFIAFLISLRLPFVKELHHKVPYFPIDIIRANIPIYLPFALRHIGANMVWVIFPLYLWSLGASKLWIGIIHFLNPFIQFIIMGRIERRREKFLIQIGLMATVLTFVLFSVSSHFLHILLIIPALAVSWACLYIGSVTYLAKNNIEKGTAVGILNSVISLSIMIGPLMGGLISQLYGYKVVMLCAAGLSFIGLLAARIGHSGEVVEH